MLDLLTYNILDVIQDMIMEPDWSSVWLTKPMYMIYQQLCKSDINNSSLQAKTYIHNFLLMEHARGYGCIPLPTDSTGSV